MAKIPPDQVKHVAKLARLLLTDDEVTTFSGQLSDVFEYMELLNEVDTEGIEPTSQVTGLDNVYRDDEVGAFCVPEELLACSPLPKERDQIKVKPVL